MDPYIQNNRSYDTDLLILRSLFALNPDTNLPISTNYIMTTDGAGGISWIDPIIFGGISLPNLVSTVAGLGSIKYVSTSFLNTALTSSLKGLGTINYISTSYLNKALTSSLEGLGTLNYVSTSYLNSALISSIEGLGTVGYVSAQTLAITTNTANAALTSSIFILNPSRYVSTGALISTVKGILDSADFALQIGDFDAGLRSTVQGLGNAGYISTSAFRSSLTSTVQGLGSAGYVSTATLRSSLTSTVQGLGSAGYVSTSFMTNYVTSAVANAGTSGNYVSVPTLNLTINTTVAGLGTVGYVSTSYLVDYVTNALNNVGTSGNYVSTPTLDLALTSTTSYIFDSERYVSTGSLTSTTIGILATATSGIAVGTLNTALASTVAGLGSGGNNGYISSLTLKTALTSTVAGLGSGGNNGYISSLTLNRALTSTVAGLGSGGINGYISTLSLQSTTQTLTDMIMGGTTVTVDRAGNLIIQGGTINVGSMTGSIIYLSTFIQSSVTYSGTNGTMSGTVLPDPNTGTDMMFSTCIIPFNTMSSFMNANSRINLDVFPTFAFNELNTTSSRSLVTPISTFIQYGSLDPSANNSNLLNYVNTSFLIANSKTSGFSNYFQQQLRIQIPGSAIVGAFSSNYILYHYMPGALTINLDPGLKASSITVNYSSTNSVFISVQNLP
jgi:hypothetical protein